MGHANQWLGQKLRLTMTHRMAMAFAPAVLKHKGLVIVDKDVVTKSFPGYWEEMNKIGIFARNSGVLKGKAR